MHSRILYLKPVLSVEVCSIFIGTWAPIMDIFLDFFIDLSVLLIVFFRTTHNSKNLAEILFLILEIASGFLIILVLPTSSFSLLDTKAVWNDYVESRNRGFIMRRRGWNYQVIIPIGPKYHSNWLVFDLITHSNTPRTQTNKITRNV